MIHRRLAAAVPRHRCGRRGLGRRLAGRRPVARLAARLIGHAGDSAGDDDSVETELTANRRRCTGRGHELTFVRRFLALAVVVIIINLCWQFFRAWMPRMLREQYLYDAKQVQYFSIGVLRRRRRRLLVDRVLVKWLAGRGLSVHGARMTTFFVCSLLTA